MATFYASYPASVSNGGNTVMEYANFAAFPSAASAGNGALAFALDTEYLYASNGSAWTVIAGPGAATLTPGSISTTTTGLTVGSGASSTVGPNVTVNVQTASGSQPGLLSAADWTTFNSKGSGTVTSVGMTVPAFLSVAGSPITSSGTLAVSLSGTALPVANGGTGLTSGTSGGILGYTASGTLASSTALTVSQLIIGGGAGATPSTLAAGSQYQVLRMGATTPAYGSINLDQSAAVTGALAIGNGGTGQATQTAAFNALSPTTTKGDLIASNGTNNVRVAVGANSLFLGANSALGNGLGWSQVDLTASVTGTLPIANGGTGQITANAGFNALSPMNSVGDIIYGGTAGAGTRLNIGATGNVLTVAGGIPSWAAPATSGTVTSVAMTVPSILSVSGTPITSSGTLAITLATETANTVFAGPTSGSAATPTFRALVGADIPGFTITNNATTGTINDLAWTTNTIRFNGASAVVLNGVVGQAEGTVLTIFNDTGSSLTIADAAAGSSATNRFSIRNATLSPVTSIILQTSSSMEFMYQQSRWRPVAPTGAVGDVILNAQVDKVFTASATVQNIDSITLPPGTWHVFGGGCLLNGAATTYTDEYDLVLSTTSTTIDASSQAGYNYARIYPPTTVATNYALAANVQRIVQSDGTTVSYLNHKATYGVSNAPTTRASMWAVKIR